MKKLLMGLLCVSVVLMLGCGGQKKADDSATKQDEAKSMKTEDPHAGHDHATDMTKAAGDTITTESGLQYIDIKVGDGASPQTGDQVSVHYTGWLLANGRKFDSSKDRQQPFMFPLGQGRVIKGWDEGVASMKVGGLRQLIIPSELGYGNRGAGAVIPPGAALVFDVELL
ncbi:FKBP-type peptidyl-prolyl cis-trans isomerase, partial [bacterium]